MPSSRTRLARLACPPGFPSVQAFAVLALLAFSPAPAAIVVGGAPVAAPADADWSALKLTWHDRGEDKDITLGTPLGNSHIGAKVRGGVATETLYLNNKTFWSGWPVNGDDPKRREALAATREALAARDYEAAELAGRGMWGDEPSNNYMPLGNLLIDFDHGAEASGYVRELDVDRAVSTVRYTIGDVTYTREAFASHPDRIIVLRLSASRPGKISITTRLQNPAQMGEHGSVAVEDGHTLVMRARAPSPDLKTWDPVKGMKHETRARVFPQGGLLAAGAAPGSIRIEGADSVTIHLADATSYNGYDREPGTQGVDPAPLVRADLARTADKTYEHLLHTHLADYQPIFRRVWVDIAGERARKNALTYQFMRYSMIAVSRSGDLPHNLIGMWSHRWEAYSRGQFFLNENVQKYYGLVETANLADTTPPLWTWMKAVAANGAETARVDWGFKGWVVCHSTDIWAATNLKASNNEWALWPVGGLWLCQNLWDHYAFGQDRAFLRDTAYPIMKGAAEFALDYLVEDADGTLVTSPSTSAENRFALEDGGKSYSVTVGSTADLALIRELFQNLIVASHTLGLDADFRARLEATLPRLKPFQISQRPSSKGELQEWGPDHSRLPEDPRRRFTPHRHSSHLISVWPLRQITETGTPELFAAAKLALQNRGGGGYHPDKSAMWARLKEGDRALATIGGNGHKTAGTFPPLYSAFAEMLVQSHEIVDQPRLAGSAAVPYILELLPALPADFAASGLVTGLRARGGHTLSIEWKNGALVRCRIDSATGAVPAIRYRGQLLDAATDPRVIVNRL